MECEEDFPKIISLSREDWDWLQNLLKNPPPPSEELKRALKFYRDTLPAPPDGYQEDEMGPEIKEIERYELGQAAKVWDALTIEQQRAIARCVDSAIGLELYYVDSENGDGKTVRYARIPVFDELIALNLARQDLEKEEGWRQQLNPCTWPVYILTNFGQIVGRYGNAKMIMEAVTGPSPPHL